MIIDQRRPEGTAEWFNRCTEAEGNTGIGTKFTQCFHGYLEDGLHIYIFSNYLSEEIVSKEFENVVKDSNVILAIKCKLTAKDRTARVCTLDTITGDLDAL